MGKITGIYVCNVSNAVGNFSSVQGYTCNEANKKHFFTAMMPEINNKNKLVQYNLNGSNPSVSGEVNCGHGNDCAYYDGKYYIARGGGSGPDKPKRVDVYDGNYICVKTYTYAKDNEISWPQELSSVTQIASMHGGYFLLGQGDIYAVCRLEGEYLRERHRFDVSAAVNKVISDRGVTTNDIINQGIFCANHRLYKVVSVMLNEKIQKNDIIEIYLNGTWPEVTSGTYQRHFHWDRTDQGTFEVEDISSPDSGKTMYGIANSTSKGYQTDAIYQFFWS